MKYYFCERCSAVFGEDEIDPGEVTKGLCPFCYDDHWPAEGPGFQIAIEDMLQRELKAALQRITSLRVSIEHQVREKEAARKLKEEDRGIDWNQVACKPFYPSGTEIICRCNKCGQTNTYEWEF